MPSSATYNPYCPAVLAVYALTVAVDTLPLPCVHVQAHFGVNTCLSLGLKLLGAHLIVHTLIKLGLWGR